MLVSDFIKKLTNTSLRNLGIVNAAAPDTLSDEYRAEIIDYINSGLLELYNRFQLKVDFLFLELQEGRTRYQLTSEHCMADWHEPDWDKYIWKESTEKFTDDLVKVLLVRDHTGIEIPLNDPNFPLSVYTPEYNILEIPTHFPIQILTIDYQCRHKPVSSDTDEIILPDSLFSTLSYYVASMACTNMNSESGVQNAAKYMQLYTNSINSYSDLGTFEPKHTPAFKKFYMGGWI